LFIRKTYCGFGWHTTCISLISSAWMVWRRWPESNAISMVIFKVRSRRYNPLIGCSVFKYFVFSTITTSHTQWYRGDDGLFVKMPLSSRHTGGWIPNVQPSRGNITKDNANIAVFIAL
jgi:hypothetical protein